MFCFVHFFFAIYNAASGQTVYDDWYITFFNILFTFFPIIFKAFTNWDVKQSDGKLVDEFLPFLYKENREHPVFNYKTFLGEFLRGLVHCAISFFIQILTLHTSVDSQGNIADLWFLSAILYINLINVKLYFIKFRSQV